MAEASGARAPEGASSEGNDPPGGGAPSLPPDSAELVWALQVMGRPAEALEVSTRRLDAEAPGWEDYLAYVRAAELAGASWRVEAEYAALHAAREQHGEALHAWVRLRAAPAPRRAAPLEALRGCMETDPWARPLLAVHFLETGEEARAVEVLADTEGPEVAALRIRALARSGEGGAAAEAAEAALRTWPDRVDVVAGIWGTGLPDDTLRPVRRQAIRAAEDLARRATDFAAWLRIWRVATLAGEEDLSHRAVRAIQARWSSMELPARQPFNAAMTRQLGRGLALSGGGLARLRLTRSEALDVAWSRARSIASSGRVQVAREAYAEAVALGPLEPELLLEAAGIMAESPVPTDPPPDLDRALTYAVNARAALGAMVPHEPAARGEWNRLLVKALATEARIRRARGESRAALAGFVAATRLDADPRLLLDQAGLQWELGHREAALASWTRAAAGGSEEALALLEEHYPGPGRPEDLVKAMRRRAEASPGDPPVDPSVVPPIEVEDDPDPRNRVPASWTWLEGDRERSLQELRGRPVVLAFWASWCAPCRKELPELEHLLLAWERDELAASIVAISLDEREADYRRATRRLSLDALSMAWAPRWGTDLKIASVPSIWVLDAEGTVVRRYNGYSPRTVGRLDQVVRALVGENP